MERDNNDLGNSHMDDTDQRDDQSDTTELDLLASDSDSDDNQSNQDPTSAQSRSEQTGATVGSDTGKFIYFLSDRKHPRILVFLKKNMLHSVEVFKR